MKEATLVIIKPDGMIKGLMGFILIQFCQPGLSIVGMRIVKPTRLLAEEHYKHIKSKVFFDETVSYFLGKFHKEKKLLAIVFYGKDVVHRCRQIAGATNPEQADPQSVRGSYGRITPKGIYENVVHASSNRTEAKREIKLWFSPDDIFINLYPTKKVKKSIQTRIWA